MGVTASRCAAVGCTSLSPGRRRGILEVCRRGCLRDCRCTGFVLRGGERRLRRLKFFGMGVCCDKFCSRNSKTYFANSVGVTACLGDVTGNSKFARLGRVSPSCLNRFGVCRFKRCCRRGSICIRISSCVSHRSLAGRRCIRLRGLHLSYADCMHRHDRLVCGRLRGSCRCCSSRRNLLRFVRDRNIRFFMRGGNAVVFSFWKGLG